MAGKKNRTQLQALFKSGAKPSQGDFRDFIDSVLNINDDGIEKPPGTDTPLKISAQGDTENLLDFYVDDLNTWRLNQKPTGANPGLNFETGGLSKLFIESGTGNLGLSTTQPIAKLHIQQSGSQDALRIEDEASDTTPLVVDTEGKVGIGIAIPECKLQVEQGELKVRASHNRATADIGRFYAQNMTQGIGVGYDQIAAIGSNQNQNIRLIPKGTGKLVIEDSNLELAGNQQIIFTNNDTSNNLKLQLWGGYGLGINNSTLFYA
ncbi:MAG: hypothetical protein F6K42_20550, partial [Leptolyngbya sp. SIO1D8]|nr:hypothetical protein [Leptolyngbya sp. SIO1D8]